MGELDEAVAELRRRVSELEQERAAELERRRQALQGPVDDEQRAVAAVEAEVQRLRAELARKDAEIDQLSIGSGVGSANGIFFRQALALSGWAGSTVALVLLQNPAAIGTALLPAAALLLALLLRGGR